MSSAAVRPRLIAALGLKPFKGVYALVSLVTFAGLIRAYFHAKHAGALIVNRTLAARHVTELLMLVALLFLAFAHGSKSPASSAADLSGVRPSSPSGVQRITRHPLNFGFALFGLAHLLVNGTVGDWIFWGGFPVFAVVSAIHQDRRMLAGGSPEFRAFYRQSSFIPFVAILDGRQTLAWRELRLRGLAIGLGLYIVLRMIHPRVFGGFL